MRPLNTVGAGIVRAGMPRVIDFVRRHAPAVTLTFTLALAAALRFPTLGTQSLWTDEGNTVAWLHGSFAHMVSAVANNESSPPLYFCLAWLWAKIFGDWIVALRALSAVLGCLTVAVAFRGALRFWSLRVAAILGLLMATSATMIWYSQEARQYALLLLLCTLSLVLWARVVVLRESAPLIWWALVSGLALATHYFAGFIVAPEALVLLVRARRTRGAVVAAATFAAFAAALVPFALYQRSTTNVSWIAGAGSLATRLRATEGLLLVNGGAGISHAWWLGRLFVLAAVALVVWRGTRAERRAVAAALTLAVSVVVLALAAAVAGFDYLIPRHLVLVELPLLVAVAVALGSARAGRIGLAVAAAGAALGIAVTLSVNAGIAYQREDVRDAVRYLHTPSAARLVILQRPDDHLLANRGLPAFQYYVPSLRFMSGAAAVDQIVVIDENVSAADLHATLVRLTHLGFRLTGAARRQVFTTYELTASHPTRLTRDQLRRAGRFARTAPVLLVQRPAQT